MRILVVTPGFYGPQGDVRIPALQYTFEQLSEAHELVVQAVSPELGPRPAWVRPWRAFDNDTQCDLAWLLWPQRTAGVAMTLRATQPRLPVVVSVMGAEGTNSRGRDRWRVQTSFSAATLITTGSGWLAERLRRAWPQYADKLRTTPLLLPPAVKSGADFGVKSVVESGAESSVKSRADSTTGVSPSPLRLVAVSSLQPIKHPELLLEIVAALRARGVDARLDVFGWSEPQSEAQWQRQVQTLELGEHVRHRGFVAPAELREALKSYDLLLHPSTHEAQGMALIEAASICLPCVCRDVGVAGVLKAAGAPVAWVNSGSAQVWANAVIQEQSGLREAVLTNPVRNSLAPWGAAFSLARYLG